ncbi:hypothetical protein [Halomontanus rarus]|uniref:hypothetical protein n=1 Tax=Halomontanus rarus TaxID=3034020 RepID=UPI00307C1BED
MCSSSASALEGRLVPGATSTSHLPSLVELGRSHSIDESVSCVFVSGSVVSGRWRFAVDLAFERERAHAHAHTHTPVAGSSS